VKFAAQDPRSTQIEQRPHKLDLGAANRDIQWNAQDIGGAGKELSAFRTARGIQCQ
jgi:hypothetical protein